MFKDSIEYDLYNDPKNRYFNQNYTLLERLNDQENYCEYLVEDPYQREQRLIVIKNKSMSVHTIENKIFFWSSKRFLYCITSYDYR